MATEQGPLRRRPPAVGRAPRSGARPRSSMACRCPGWSSGPGRSRRTSSPPAGAHVTLRRRPRLRRPVPRRHRGDGRPRSGSDDRRGRTPAASRHHPHAPDRGRRLGRRGADPPVRCRRRGSSRSRRPTPTAGRSGSPGTSAAGPRSSSTTTATTARSTRRSRCSARTGRSCRSAARSGRRSMSPRRPASSSSTTSPGSRRRSPTATWRRSCSSPP